MKKILFFIICFFSGLYISLAANNIYSIDIKVYIDEEGTANIEEVWNVKGSDGTEWYKVLSNLGNSKLSNYEVYMDGNPLTYKNWNVNESLQAKKGYYGIYNGNELCFGKYDYEKHIFNLKYTLSNFIFNTNDAQVIYFNFIDKLSDVNFDNFSLEISTYYDIPNTLDVWGYGYKGYAYVEDGKIKMSNKKDMDDKYVVLLAKFPLNTYNTDNKYFNFKTFNDVYEMAEEGASSDNGSIFSIILSILFVIVFLIIVFGGQVKSIICMNKGLGEQWEKIRFYKKYEYISNKKITKKTTPLYRNIPCNKDIYYANALSLLNGWNKNDTNILGAILLKWIKNGSVTVKKENEKNIYLVLNGTTKINHILEIELYDMIYMASKDGLLESKELQKWVKKNNSEFLDLFTKIRDEYINQLKDNNYIFKRENKKQCKKENVMNDILYEESKKLYGLKLFLDEFSNIKQKEAINVKIWDEYLMFAYIFGNAKKIMKQFKKLYPEVIEEMNIYNLDFNSMILLNNMSITAANNANATTQSYMGGGIGSFGGGGGGSR